MTFRGENRLDLFSICPFDTAAAIAQLELLGLFDRDTFIGCQPACKRTPPKGKHACLFDATLPHKGDIGRTTADVDEDSAAIGTGVRTQAACQGVRFRDDRDERQIQALGYGLQRAQLHQRRKCAKKRQREMAPPKADWIGYRLSIDPHRDHRRVGQAHLDILVSRLGGKAIFCALQ